MGWELVVYWLISTALAYAFAPKPEKPKAATLADFQVPTADPDRSIPVVFGTVWINDPNVVWYGHLTTKKIKKDGGLFSGDVTVGYKYYLGMHAALCYPVDSWLKLKMADRIAWSGTASSGSITINAPELFGGKEKEGGVSGTVDILNGASTQGQNSYLVSVLGSGTIPAFRGVFSLVFRQCYWGTSPYIKNPSFLVARTGILTDRSTQWYPSKASPGNGGLNPAHILREAFTNQDWGMAYPVTQMDDTSFTACADTLYSEGFGLCFKWNSPDEVGNFTQIVIDHCGAVVDQDQASGKFVMRLIRGGYDKASLPQLTASNSELVSFERKGWGETVNEVVVTYHDTATDKDLPVAAQDLGNIQVQGAVISEQVSLPGIPNAELASTVCQSLLKSKSAAVSLISLANVHRGIEGLYRGGVFRYTNLRLGIADVVYRVAEISYGDLIEGGITLKAVEDVFALGSNTYVAQQTSNWTSPNSVPTALDYSKIVAPSYYDLFKVLSQTELAQADATYRTLGFYGSDSASDFYGYRVMVSADNANSYTESLLASPSSYAQLDTAMDKLTTAITLKNMLRAFDVVGDGSISVLIGEERMRLDSFDSATGAATVARAVDISVPQEHSVDDPVWFLDDTNIDLTRTYAQGENVDIKLLAVTSLGTYDLTSAAKIDVQVQACHTLPMPAAHLTINGNYYPTETTTLITTVAWAGRNRVTLQDQLVGDTVATSYTEEAGVIYIVEVYDQTMTLLESADVAAPTRTYDFDNTVHGATELTFNVKARIGSDYSLYYPSVTVASNPV